MIINVTDGRTDRQSNFCSHVHDPIIMKVTNVIMAGRKKMATAMWLRFCFVFFFIFYFEGGGLVLCVNFMVLILHLSIISTWHVIFVPRAHPHGNMIFFTKSLIWNLGHVLSHLILI